MRAKLVLLAIVALLVNISLPSVVSTADMTSANWGVERHAALNPMRMTSDIGATGV